MKQADAVVTQNSFDQESSTTQEGLLGQLRQRRERRELSQSDLARTAGVSRMTVQRMEAPQADTQLSSFIAVAESLGMRVQLVDDETGAPVTSSVQGDEWNETVERLLQVAYSNESAPSAGVRNAMREVLVAVSRNRSEAAARVPLTHRGLYHTRTKLAHNKREALFAAAWLQENSPRPHFGQPVHESLVPDCTPDQATAMATVVQWLGSQIGFLFLRQVLQAAGDEVIAAEERRARG